MSCHNNRLSLNDILPSVFLSKVQEVYSLEKVNNLDDGNCMFDAVAISMAAAGLGFPTHVEVRRAAVAYEKEHEDDFINAVMFAGERIMHVESEKSRPREFRAHLRRMRRSHVWGTEMELRAIACHYQIRLRVLQPSDDEEAVTDLGSYAPDGMEEERNALPQITILFGRDVSHYWATCALHDARRYSSDSALGSSTSTVKNAVNSSGSLPAPSSTPATTPSDKSPSPVQLGSTVVAEKKPAVATTAKPMKRKADDAGLEENASKTKIRPVINAKGQKATLYKSMVPKKAFASDKAQALREGLLEKTSVDKEKALKKSSTAKEALPTGKHLVQEPSSNKVPANASAAEPALGKRKRRIIEDSDDDSDNGLPIKRVRKSLQTSSASKPPSVLGKDDAAQKSASSNSLPSPPTPKAAPKVVSKALPPPETGTSWMSKPRPHLTIMKISKSTALAKKAAHDNVNAASQPLPPADCGLLVGSRQINMLPGCDPKAGSRPRPTIKRISKSTALANKAAEDKHKAASKPVSPASKPLPAPANAGLPAGNRQINMLPGCDPNAGRRPRPTITKIIKSTALAKKAAHDKK